MPDQADPVVESVADLGGYVCLQPVDDLVDLDEKCWDACRLMAVHGVFAGIVGAGRVKRTERGDRMWQNWLERHLTQAEDLGSWELLSRV